MKKTVECIHGLYWKTCNICFQLKEAEVVSQKDKIMQSRKSKSLYDCIDLQDVEIEREIDYDFDDMNVS